jgi:phosphohistidine phosphatase
MELLLIRHGEAVRLGSRTAATDRERSLTPAGAEYTRRAATALNILGLRLDAILTSPYARTMQTAELLAEGLEHRPELRPRDFLGPNADWQALVHELQRDIEFSTIAWCGHEPDLSASATRLLGGNDRPSLIFHTGSVAMMHVDLGRDPPQASLRWFLDSRQLDLIAQTR